MPELVPGCLHSSPASSRLRAARLRAAAGAAKPRAPSATSIPAMLSLLHAEWDALMLESYELKDQLDKARKVHARS